MISVDVNMCRDSVGIVGMLSFAFESWLKVFLFIPGRKLGSVQVGGMQNGGSVKRCMDLS